MHGTFMLFSLLFSHRHACVIRGQVMTSDGTPLVGVNISFVNNPLFGYTVSRQDGRYGPERMKVLEILGSWDLEIWP